MTLRAKSEGYLRFWHKRHTAAKR
ncbi:hypothetical protein SPHINGOAX6_30201 [Sphingomonas sp. AX6]|nr:hypothetical protein SPHINGOAX6_30201 [Sphingomonas sp. AX6]